MFNTSIGNIIAISVIVLLELWGAYLAWFPVKTENKTAKIIMTMGTAIIIVKMYF